MKNKSFLYYSVNAILSKDRLMNFIIGIRGGGKTYGFTKYIINLFLNKGKKTIFMRRMATELDNAFMNEFFKDMIINNEFPNYKFKCFSNSKTGVGYAYLQRPNSKEWEQFIMFMPLSVALKHKSTNFSEYWFIIFDEFLIDTMGTNLHYINGWNEPKIFLEFYESVARTRENVKCVFIGNSITTINPYFTYFKITFDKNNEWLLTDFVCVHNYTNENFKNNKVKTKWGKFLSNNEIGDYMLDNKFINESDDFIEEKTKNAELLFNVAFEGKTYGIYQDLNKGRLYVDNRTDNDFITYCFTTDDMKPNFMLLDRLKMNKGNVINMTIKQAFKNGYLRFNSQETKQRFYEVLRLLK